MRFDYPRSAFSRKSKDCAFLLCNLTLFHTRFWMFSQCARHRFQEVKLITVVAEFMHLCVAPPTFKNLQFWYGLLPIILFTCGMFGTGVFEYSTAFWQFWTPPTPTSAVEFSQGKQNQCGWHYVKLALVVLTVSTWF